MTVIHDNDRDEKLQYNVNREAAKLSALSSEIIDKYEYLTGQEILPPDQRRVIEQAMFTCPPLGKAFEKQTKTTEEQGKYKLKFKSFNRRRTRSNRGTSSKKYDN